MGDTNVLKGFLQLRTVVHNLLLGVLEELIHMKSVKALSPQVGVVKEDWSVEDPVQVTFASLVNGSKIRGSSPKTSPVANVGDINQSFDWEKVLFT
ncbi:hypothetical protein TNCV_3996891 [Trichonephila clavipes]|nr:hypothetical protein TNCV_3996891 [Trichonephila clavipes]